MSARSPKPRASGCASRGAFSTLARAVACCASLLLGSLGHAQTPAELPPPGPGAPDAWELALRGSFQRLSDGVVSSQVQVGTLLGYYVHPNLEPFASFAVDFQRSEIPDGGASASATNLAFGAGLRASFEVADRLHPYLAGSPGLLLRTTDITGTESDDQLDFVASVQAGLQVVLVPRVVLDVAVAYDRIFSEHGEDLLTVPLSLGVFF
ncbi:MAG: hypothetical protein U0610_08900 [bacterium]